MAAFHNHSRVAFFSSIALLALTAGAASTGCTVETSSGSDVDGSVVPDGAADAGPDSAESCAATGTGTVALVVTGLPAGVEAKVAVTGATDTRSEVAGSTTLADLAAGPYSVSAKRVARPDPIVRTLYEPTVSTSSFCLEGSATQTVTVSYAEIAPSNELWSTNANNASGQLLGFAGADLAATGAPGAKVAMKGAPGAGVGSAVAFDKDGNLWTLGGTTTDVALSRYPAASFAASGEKTPDRKIAPVLPGCVPQLTALAFEPSGALWINVLCADRLLRVAPETLSASNEYTPAETDFALGTHGPRGIAFDAAGNMWVADATSLHLYPAASLAAGQAHVSTFKIDVKTAGDAELPPDALAFDKDGNLWVTSFGGNKVSKLTPADLLPVGSAKSVVPSVTMTISVGALLESLAFDESGGLWLTYSQGKVARLAPSQLGTSTNAGDPTIPETVVTSADIGYAGGLAFFPAPAGLPIFSRAD